MDIVERLRDEASMYDADDVDLHLDAADEIERLRQQNANLVEALQNIADGPRDVEKSYISLLHEVQSEARDAIAKTTGEE